MLFLQSQDFKYEDIVKAKATEVLFQGTWLIKGLSFAKHLRSAALKACRQQLDAGKLCILVENDFELILWTEKLQNDQENKVSPSADTELSLAPKSPLVKDSQVLIKVSPEFIKFCQEQLSEYIIPPIAEQLLSKILKQYPEITTHELVELLTVKIPDKKQAEKFKKSFNL